MQILVDGQISFKAKKNKRATFFIKRRKIREFQKNVEPAKITPLQKIKYNTTRKMREKRRIGDFIKWRKYERERVIEGKRGQSGGREERKGEREKTEKRRERETRRGCRDNRKEREERD